MQQAYGWALAPGVRAYERCTTIIGWHRSCEASFGQDCLNCETGHDSICAAQPEGDLLDLQALSTSVPFGVRES